MSNDDSDNWKVTMPQAFTAIRADAAAKNRKQGTVVCPKCGGDPMIPGDTLCVECDRAEADADRILNGTDAVGRELPRG